ncbi:hypothetical protein [Kineosporia succinea]|uniref:DUF4190 domain-containing protein n=1 Tax=Kineosporia succinea TaxID=84632 RepID=A0ABT9P3L6_9ACTN|nr:hypothetical protein [Kineosporia succinea]MDP9827273.1 hypothetical protein [Kineosporia succinea]
MPSTPNPGPSNDWPDAPENTPVPHDDRAAGVTEPIAAVPGPVPDAAADSRSAAEDPTDECSRHRPPLPPGQIPAAWLPSMPAAGPEEPDGGRAGHPTPHLTSTSPESGETPSSPRTPAASGPSGPSDPSGAEWGSPPPHDGSGGPGPGGFGPGGPSYGGPGQPGPLPSGQPGQGAWFQSPSPSGPPAGGPGGNPGWNVPARRRKTADELKALALKTRDRSRLFVLMVIGMLIVVQLALPFRLAGIALGLAAAYVGMRALVGLAEIRRAGMGSRGIILTLFGLGMTGYLLIVLMSHAVYYPVWSELESCKARANTDVAQQACQDRSREQFDSILDNLQDRSRNP